MPPPPPSRIGKEWEEGTGESSSPPRPSSVHHDLRHRIFERLLAAGEQGESDPSSFWSKLCAHFDKLPDRYLIDLGVRRAEDVLLHRSVLDEVAHNGNRAVFKARFLEVPTWTWLWLCDSSQKLATIPPKSNINPGWLGRSSIQPGL